jgi:trehalose 6-phosphate synthase
MAGQVICVSNRVTSLRGAAQAGGVAVAIAAMLKSQRGLWLGWSGKLKDTVSEQPEFERFGRFGSRLATLDLTREQHAGHYLGYSNSVLWPVFHNRVNLAHFESGYFSLYAEVNHRFAIALARLIGPEDLIWVHDYHLIPLAAELRRLGVANPIGYFLHIPFPPSQSFLAVPEYFDLAQDLAAYDLIGLQTTTDVSNMIDFFVHGVDGRLLSDGRMRLGDKIFAIESHPIGIDPDDFAQPGTDPSPFRHGRHLRRIIGVDRLDYTKGLPQKFRAYRRYLEKFPENAGSIVLTQIVAPSRDSLEAYSDIRKELESLAGKINGAHGDLDWVPIHYMRRSTTRRRLAAIYRASKVGMVTPLRDGMNLVAKEYVAAQDPTDPGVLILSRFAGAAEQMAEALIVNPYDVDQMANALDAALSMPLQERLQRHAALMEGVARTNVTRWRDGFLARLSALTTAHSSAPNESPPSTGAQCINRNIENLRASLTDQEMAVR